jgi:hypothetical protein
MSNAKVMAEAFAKLIAMEKATNPKPRDIKKEIEALNIAIGILKNNKAKQKELLIRLKALMLEAKKEAMQ